MFNHAIFLLILQSIVVSSDKSFTVVIDTTVSMSDELNTIKANIGQVVHSINRSDVNKYILVAFKDTVVESAFITETPGLFISQLNTLAISGGSDCPENSLAGIEAALRASQQESFIFVFTDAYANDYERFLTIESLCRESHSQVMIFLSGFCLQSGSTPSGNLDVYYDVVNACSGAFLRFNTSYELRQVFNFMKKAVNTEWTNIIPQKFKNNKQLSFSVDPFTTDFLISVSGHFVTTSITDARGQHLRSYEKVLLTRHAQVIHLRQPYPGEYSVSIRSEGASSVSFYERNYIPFQYGFSTKQPRGLEETSRRPIAGSPNFVIISIDKAIKLDSIEWVNFGENAKSIEYVQEVATGLFVAPQHMVEHGKSFRIWVIGQDMDTNQRIKGSTKYIFPQVQVVNASWIAPEVEILYTEQNLIDFGTEFTLVCKVNAFPKPNIRWGDGKGSVLYGEEILLEIPSVHISYLTISNVTDNSTLYCISENALGNASQAFQIFVNRTFSFDVIQTPQDTSVKYGEDLTLACQVDAYPEAKVKWNFNNTEVDSFSNPNAIVEGNTLLVKNVGIDDGGSYECVASNEVETRYFTADVRIAGLEAPVVTLEKTEIFAKPGDWITDECRITGGTPVPQLTWQYKTLEGFEFDDLPTSATVDEGKLKISSLEKENGGIYRCTASNVIGQDSKEVTITIQFPPTIKNNVTTATVREGNTVQLSCDVEAIPEATVHWEMSQDDVSITLGDRHRVDERHTLYFQSLWNDSGNYHCIAENSVGRAEMTITLEVLVPPYIEPPQSATVSAKVGSTVELPCNVLYGSPAATIRWEITARDSVFKTAARRNSTLHLENISQSNEGSYLCIAENRISTDSIKYTLKVHN